MPTAKEVFQSQRKLEDLNASLGAVESNLYYRAEKEGGSLMNVEEAIARNSEVRQIKAEIANQQTIVEAGQRTLGGKVFRIPGENMNRFEKKISKLNRKADKLGCAQTVWTLLEVEKEFRKREGLLVWNFIVMNATKPQVPGYRFIAALDHTVQQKAGDPVIVKQVPSIEEELDLSAWRHADAQCDHCHQLRSRNTTYLVEEIATGQISKVGSSCLADFIGGNDPERMAFLLEALWALEQDLNAEADEYNTHGSRDTSVRGYLTHVAACIRDAGWVPRSSQNPLDGMPTASRAWDNIANYKKRDKRGNLLYIPLEDEDGVTAEKAIEWAKGIEGGSDFDHNLRTMANLDYMPKKGDGIVAYIVQGYVKDETKRIEREAQQKAKEEREANAEKAPVTKERIEITGVVVNEYMKEWGPYDKQHKMTVVDDRGFTVNGSVPTSIYKVQKGDKVRFTARLKNKDGDEYYAYFSRPTKAEILEPVA